MDTVSIALGSVTANLLASEESGHRVSVPRLVSILRPPTLSLTQSVELIFNFSSQIIDLIKGND